MSREQCLGEWESSHFADDVNVSLIHLHFHIKPWKARCMLIWESLNIVFVVGQQLMIFTNNWSIYILN